ncbi:MAG: hypothetical protein Q9195_000198 [Heterodermia aff. obscurata]
MEGEFGELPVEAPHISSIAFDTEQELLWIGDETVRNAKQGQLTIQPQMFA